MIQRTKTKKTCTKCLQWYPYSNFHVDNSKIDGHTYLCKACSQRDEREKYARNREAILRRQSAYIKSGRKKYQRDPVRKNAQILMRVALAKGLIKKGPCKVGGGCNGRIEGHHPDYSKPLEVTWLCKKHHVDEHRKDFTNPTPNQ